ncbi:hypothetical protein LSAT2_003312, partial [Lamellibrachia satsuma]
TTNPGSTSHAVSLKAAQPPPPHREDIESQVCALVPAILPLPRREASCGTVPGANGSCDASRRKVLRAIRRGTRSENATSRRGSDHGGRHSGSPTIVANHNPQNSRTFQNS